VEPDALQTIIYSIGLATIAGVYVKGKVLFSNWLDTHFSFWTGTAIYHGATAASVAAAIALFAWLG